VVSRCAAPAPPCSTSATVPAPSTITSTRRFCCRPAGVSFVATYRSEFERIIQQSSWSGLMDRLRKRAIHATLVDRAPRMVSTPR